jgi:hypothetical protein
MLAPQTSGKLILLLAAAAKSTHIIVLAVYQPTEILDAAHIDTRAATQYDFPGSALSAR